MEHVQKTVFISYRRTNAFCALAILQNLTRHEFDVFLDYNGLASGDFERVILENITSRAHFLVLLAPAALDRCNDPSDLFRREIETALFSGRNIVPLLLDGFDFAAPSVAAQLPEALMALKRYQGLPIRLEYFDEAMDRLRNRYLNVPLTAVIHPASVLARQAAAEQKAAVTSAPTITREDLAAEQQRWYQRGLREAEAAAEEKRQSGRTLFNFMGLVSLLLALGFHGLVSIHYLTLAGLVLCLAAVSLLFAILALFEWCGVVEDVSIRITLLAATLLFMCIIAWSANNDQPVVTIVAILGAVFPLGLFALSCIR